MLAMPLHAAADMIACPFSERPARTPSTLPTGWWTTQAGTNSFLTFAAANGNPAADVVEVVGVSVLRCSYGDYGALFRQAPPGSHCSVAAAGFACESAN